MSSFEDYLKKNKEQLELDHVNPEIWLNIENKMLKQKHRRRGLYLRLMSAAAAVLLLLVIVLQFSGNGKQDANELLAQYGINNQEWTQQVNQKKAALSSATVPKDRKEDFDLLLQQLEFLDGQYNDYLQYVEQHGYEAFIGQQILNYYKTKIDLLDKIQQEIEKINYYENKYNQESEKVQLSL